MFPCLPRSLLAGVLLASALPAHAELPHAPAYIDDSAYPAAARQRILPPMFEQRLGSLRYLAKPGDPLITPALCRRLVVDLSRFWGRLGFNAGNKT